MTDDNAPPVGAGRQAASAASSEDGGTAARIASIGGLIAVAVGVLGVVILGLAALLLLALKANFPTEIVAISTGAFGVIGTVVGAFFGLKVGTDQTKTLVKAAQGAEAKADVYAAHVPDSKGGAVAEAAESAAVHARAAL